MRRQDRIAKERYLAQLEFAKSATVENPFETRAEQSARIERAKKDIAYMIKSYFPHYATSESGPFQIKFSNVVKKDQLYKGFCQWGRGLAKSVYNNIFIPFWLWMNGEPIYLVIVGNNADRAAQLLNDLKAEFEANPSIIHDFGEQIQYGSWEDKFWVTKGGFVGQALGIGQSVRGLRKKATRPTHIVMDDVETKELVKNPKRQDEIAKWVEQDLIPTMDGPVRRFIQANNKFAPRMIQTVLQERHPDWHIDNTPAYDFVTYKPAWAEKYTPEYYRVLESEIGILAARAEYGNNPHIEGKIFKSEQIQWTKLPRLDHFKIITGFWDVAYAGTSTADYNAVRVWGLYDKSFFYIDSFVKQTKMRDPLSWMAHFQVNLPSSVIVHWKFEAQFWNDEVERTIQEVEDEFGIELKLVKVNNPKTKKYDRIISLQPYYQNSRIYYNEKKKAHKDTQTGLAQLYGIEPGYKGHDDAPDADHNAIEFLSKHIHIKSRSKPLTGKFKVSTNRW